MIRKYESSPGVITIPANKNMMIKLEAHDEALIDETANRIVEVLRLNGSDISGPIALATDGNIITIRWTGGDDGQGQEQTDNRQYKRLINILNPMPKAVEALLMLKLPENIAIDIRL